MSSKNKYIVRKQGEEEAPPPQPEPAPEPKAQSPKRKKSHFTQSTIDTNAILEALDTVDDDLLNSLIDDSMTVNVRRGDQVSGKVSEVNADFLLVSIGTKSEAFINIDDTVGGPFRKGDAIKATVLAQGTNGIRLTMNLSEATDEDGFLQAFESKSPVIGTVKARNSGGYSVMVGSRRAFCPSSQIDYQSEADPDSYLNQQYSFVIQELSSNDMLVSRRAILEAEAAQHAAAALDSLNTDTTVSGTVKAIKDFGIFVDIGGIQGLVPRSQFRLFQRMPIEGDQIDVDIVSIDRDNKRISLRPQFDDPWQNIAAQFQVDDIVEVKITKIESFGLFAELRPGVEGLIHIRNLSTKRVNDINQFTQIGAHHRVRILDIDLVKRRIGLGIRQVDQPDAEGQSQTQNRSRSFTPPPDNRPQISQLGQLLQGLKNKN